jgi:hypothetical protein
MKITKFLAAVVASCLVFQPGVAPPAHAMLPAGASANRNLYKNQDWIWKTQEPNSSARKTFPTHGSNGDLAFVFPTGGGGHAQGDLAFVFPTGGGGHAQDDLAFVFPTGGGGHAQGDLAFVFPTGGGGHAQRKLG